MEAIHIDHIMALIDWNRNTDGQAAGIKMAEDVENFNVFLQPCNANYSKNVWDNCAKILSKRTDEELIPYLSDLFEWMRDLNWPVTLCILDRLREYRDHASFDHALEACIRCARAAQDEVWESNLRTVKRK